MWRSNPDLAFGRFFHTGGHQIAGDIILSGSSRSRRRNSGSTKCLRPEAATILNLNEISPILKPQVLTSSTPECSTLLP